MGRPREEVDAIAREQIKDVKARGLADLNINPRQNINSGYDQNSIPQGKGGGMAPRRKSRPDHY